mgnify:CR=1 FL=1
MFGRMLFCFFFKQKTAYEMLRSLVGSEMCIRDSAYLKVLMDEVFGRENFISSIAIKIKAPSGVATGLSLIHI